MFPFYFINVLSCLVRFDYICSKINEIMRTNNRLLTVNKWNKKRILLNGGAAPNLTTGVNDVSTGSYLLDKKYGGTGGINFSGQNLSPTIQTFGNYQGTNYALSPTQNTTVNNTAADNINTSTGIVDNTLSTGNPKENVDYTQFNWNDNSSSFGNAVQKASPYAEVAAEGTKYLLTKGAAETIGKTVARSAAKRAGQAVIEAAPDVLTSSTPGALAVGEGVTSGAAEGAGAGAAAASGASSVTKGLVGMAGAGANVGLKYLVSDGLSSKTGNNIADIGNMVGSAVGTVLSSTPYWWIGPVVSAASGLIGGVVNRGWGHQLYGKGEAMNYRNQMSGFTVDSSNADSIEQASSLVTNAPLVTYRDGWWTHKGRDEAAAENEKSQAVLDFAQRSVTNAAENNALKQQQNLLANYTAYGGPIRTRGKRFDYGGPLIDMINNNEDMGAVEYGLMTDYLTNKNRQIQSRDKISSPVGFGTPKGLFALGGTLQANGSNWGNTTQVNAGGSHEQNIHDGVQMGVDNEGTPNLVEENEVVYNDYVFSDRLVCPKDVRMELGVRGKKDMSFADVAKKLTKESEERSNDPISQAGLDANMKYLAEAQEEVKKEMEAERAKAEFEALSPEEQTAVMEQRAAQQQTMEQQAAIQQQAMAQQAQAQGITPEQLAMAQQQAQGNIGAYGGKVDDPTDWAYIEEEGVPYACGGKLYSRGGSLEEEETPLAYGGRLYAFGDYLKKYFAGQTYDDILKGIYGVSGIKDVKYDDWKQKYSNLDALSDEDTKTLLPMLQQYYYTKNPEAANSKVQFSFTPTSTWNPLVIGATAAQGNTYNQNGGVPGAADKYKSISEDAFLNDPAYLELPDEQKKLKGQALAKALEGTKAYKQFRDYISADEGRALQWLGNLAEHGSKYAGNRVKKNDDGTYSWNDKYSFKDFGKMMQDISYDADQNKEALSIGHLTSSPQTQWTERAFAKNADGTYTRLTSSSADYELINTDPYLSSDGTLNYKDSYYRLKSDATQAASGNGNGTEENTESVSPKHRWEGWRYAGLLGPAAGLGLWAAGVGKPDTSGLDAAVQASSVSPIMADVEHIGDYMTYRPFDRNYYANKLSAQAGATRRAILNSGAGASRGAQILAADYNAQEKLGDLFRQAEEYNLAQREKVATFNRDTNKFNKEADNRALLQYAQDYNNQRRYAAQMAMEAARLKMDADSQWNQGLYAGISNLANAASALGKENASMNQIARMGANGVLGVMNSDDDALGSTILKSKKQKTAAHGGRINRKRRGGLTY